MCACSGQILAPISQGSAVGEGPAGPGDAEPAPEVPVVCTDVLPALPQRVLRVDSPAYVSTLNQLFNWRGQYLDTPFAVVAPFSRTNPADLFTTFPAGDSVDEYELDELLAVSRTVAEAIAPGPSAARYRMSCDPATAACRAEAFQNVSTVVWSRPPSATEAAERMAEMDAYQADGATPGKAIELMLRSLLMSPEMIFRPELGGPKGLSSIERGRLLSFTLRGTPADAPLWELATHDGLLDEATLRAEVRRLMQEPQHLASLRRFLREYFQWDKVLKVRKDPKLPYNQQKMIDDVEAAVERHVTGHARAGLLRALLTSEEISLSEETAPNWKVENPMPGVIVAKGRPGVLAQPAWLAAFSEPDRNNMVRRGRFIRERLLCMPVPSIPVGVIPMIPEHAGLTYRQTVEQKTSGAGCTGCHVLMNDLGGAFEAFNHVGAPQSTDNGAPVTTAGVLNGPGFSAVPFTGPTELMQLLADSPAVHDCYVTNLFSFYVGRTPTREDQCELARLKALYRSSHEDTLAVIEELIVWQATTPRLEVTP